MRTSHFLLSILILMSALNGCRPAEKGQGSIVYFLEQEPGVAAYRTRMLTSGDFLRIDEGDQSGDFMLFNRRERTIYSINSEDRRILVIKPKKFSVDPPSRFEHRVEKDDHFFPAIGGNTVTHYRHYTNEQLCYELYAAKGLLPDALEVMREYLVVLAAEQAVMLAVTPEELQTVCAAANHVFLPTRHLQHGFPVRQLDMDGRSRELLDYEIGVSLSAKLFQLPEGYQYFSMEEMRNTLNP